MATDIDAAGSERLAADLCAQYGAGRAISLHMDVTDEQSVRAAFAPATLRFGSVDIVVNNAGLASSAAIAETTLAEWQKNIAVLATGYFLVAREGFATLAQQGRGGSLVFVASDNNQTARSMRPLVIARTISGGTRSPQGGTTRVALASVCQNLARSWS